MIYSDKKLAQRIVECCVQQQITQVVISPGSRNAPLTIGFTNHSEMETYSIVDERSAAFFALGLAQFTKKACALVCTSGSALLNYYPAVAEAFYSQIPLVIISADRPADRIDIGDGQTIRQRNVFANHILESVNLAEVEDSQNELILDALQRATTMKGPVHLNVPFDEPLYGTTEALQVTLHKKSYENPRHESFPTALEGIWKTTQKKLILVGVHEPNPILNTVLNELAKDPSVLIFTETTANLHGASFVSCIDQLIFSLDEAGFAALQPMLLISFGGMVISKRIKSFLRSYQPAQHWHIDPIRAYDTYFCLNKHVKMDPIDFFTRLSQLAPMKDSTYRDYWLEQKNRKKRKHHQFLAKAPFCDLKVFQIITESLPRQCALQIANSSVIRYAQLFDMNGRTTHCNRGTSGIDGSTSTAIGAALKNEQQTVFITGDVSFFYDSNALWNSYIKKDFRIIIINNNGGGIFKIIPGPDQSTALPYFETPHGLTAEHLCTMFRLDYAAVTSLEELIESLEDFYTASERPKVLEIFTPSDKNAQMLKDYFRFLV
ncbi:2-succinyl-5-enolpyruvyl-6-hydroxy-3-cyclohexene-1-carboxylic-acid synthase [Flavobacteriaceae bacterium F08102]|nr:2-succinyl-5-enolpyruvyl-6-hydroxy-3-cyclohexene-1-carboxylic-acid synthase [Flavobacteriaceae bacterium F08102]